MNKGGEAKMGQAQNFHVINGVLQTNDGTDTIRGIVNITGNHVKSLKGVSRIKGHAYFVDCPNLESLGSLSRVHGSMSLAGCFRLKELGSLKFVRGDLNLIGTHVDAVSDEVFIGKFLIGKDGLPVTRDFLRRSVGPTARSLSLSGLS